MADRLYDLAMEHALHARRFERGLIDRIGKLLNSADTDLEETLAKRLVKAQGRGFDPGPATTARIRDMLAEIRAINSAVYSKVHDNLSGQLEGLAEHEAGWAKGALTSVAVDTSVIVPSAAFLKTLVETSPLDGHLLSSWTKHLDQKRQGAIEQQIRLGILQGESVDKMVSRVVGTKDVPGVLDASRRSAQTLVITANSTIANNARLATYRENPKVVPRLRVVATLDSRTSPICQARDGRTYAIDSDHPIPPFHLRCRTVLVPDIGAIPGLNRASADGPVPANLKMGDWLKTQPMDVQERLMGKERAAIFREGKIPHDRFFNSDDQFYSLDELKRREGMAGSSATSAAPRAPTPTPAPAPTPVKRFDSPIDDSVTAETIKVQPKRDVTKALNTRLAEAAKDVRYDAAPEFKGVKAENFGKVAFSAEFSNEAASAISAIMPELDTLADTFKVPRLRAIRSTTGAIGNMGDGTLGLNPTYFNSFAAGVGGGGSTTAAEARVAALAAQMDELRAKLVTLKAAFDEAKAGGDKDRYFAIYAEQAPISKAFRKISKAHHAARQKVRTTERVKTSEASTWKPGDDVKTRPYNATDYFVGIDKARNVLFHEFAHHVHQMLGKTGRRRVAGSPPLERRLKSMFFNKFHGAATGNLGKTADRKALVSTTYGTKDEFEWFAEGFGLYMMKRRDLVDSDLIALIEEVIDDQSGV